MTYHYPYCKETTAYTAHNISNYKIALNGITHLDACSNLYNSPFGYNNKVLHNAVIEQLGKLDVSHTFSTGNGIPLTNNATDALINELADIQYQEFNCHGRIALFNSGSEAIDFSLGLIQSANSSPLHVFVLEGSYHGISTFLMHASKTILPMWDITIYASLDEYINNIINIIKQSHCKSSCILYESFIGANAGIIIDIEVLQAILNICNILAIPTIVDEVISGFGRLTLSDNKLFSSGKCKLSPDIVCFSKQLTNGILPMAGIFINNSILANNCISRGGVTNGGGPVQSALAYKCIKLIRDPQINAMYITNKNKLSIILNNIQNKFNDVITVSQQGLFASIHINKKFSKSSVGNFLHHGQMLADNIIKAGAIVRGNPLGINIAPGYLFSEDDMVTLHTSLTNGIHSFIA